MQKRKYTKENVDIKMSVQGRRECKLQIESKNDLGSEPEREWNAGPEEKIYQKYLVVSKG